MKPSELLTRALILSVTSAVILIPLALWARAPLVHARVAGAGGWGPNVLRARVGQPLHLRLTSDDVVHSFAVGGMEMEPVDVLPGKITDVTLIFDHPGTVTFYCTRWCGLDHWRMRGTIEVTGPESDPAPPAAPLYLSLGLDLDAPHDAPVTPDEKPSAARGRELTAHLLSSYLADTEFYRARSPFQAWSQLRDDPKLAGLSEAQLWDGAALIWQSNTTQEGLAGAARLFAQNCAACHGESGRGDGVFADALSAGGSVLQGMGTQRPVDFTDPRRTLGAAPALLQGKILRGGMGTGMPMWGAIFTERQTWDLVAYLYSLQFEYSFPENTPP